MKKILIISVVSGILTTASVYAKPYAVVPGSVNFNAVNQVLDTIVKEAISIEAQNGDNYDFITPYFDPARSSLENESIAYTLAGSVKNAPWSKGRGTLSISVDTYLKSDRTSRPKGVNAVVKTDIGLDLLEVARYTTKKLLDKNQLQYDSEFEVRERSILNRLTVVNNMQDFYSLAIESRDITTELFDREITKKMALIDCLRNLTCGEIGHDQWGNLQMDLNEYMWAQISLRDYIQAKSMSLGNSVTFNNSVISIVTGRQEYSTDSNENVGNYDTTTVTISPTNLTVSTSGFISVKEDKMDKFHLDAKREFSAVQVDDATKHARLQQSGRDILVSFRKLISVEKPSVISNPFNLND